MYQGNSGFGTLSDRLRPDPLVTPLHVKSLTFRVGVNEKVIGNEKKKGFVLKHCDEQCGGIKNAQNRGGIQMGPGRQTLKETLLDERSIRRRLTSCSDIAET